MGSVKLGDVAQESRETIENARDLPTVGLEHLTPGVLELERWENNAETTFSKGFKKDQILFGRRRAYLKKAAVASFDGVCSGDITVIEAIPNKIDKRLLPFVVQNDVFFDFAMSRSAGGLSPRVKWKDLKEYEFNLPPIEEQARIADLLWAMNDAKKAYRNLLAATNELVKARFVEMFGNPESNPLNFPVKRFEEICENLDYRRKPITASMRKAGRYPYYGASGVVDYVEDFIFDEDILLISEDGANLRVRSTPIAFSVSGKVWV
ncbi:MAG: restriction endonuclease subunit S, partial [Thermoguttaceae bacterium]|nr:restriction endonuclease subunit S [Thermoguttaceae bacterium]